MGKKSNYRFSLVDEAYDGDEGRELLMALLAETSRIYNLSSLRVWEQTGQKDEPSEKKINALNEARQTILEIIDEADAENLSIEITAEIKRIN